MKIPLTRAPGSQYRSIVTSYRQTGALNVILMTRRFEGGRSGRFSIQIQRLRKRCLLTSLIYQMFCPGCVSQFKGLDLLPFLLFSFESVAVNPLRIFTLSDHCKSTLPFVLTGHAIIVVNQYYLYKFCSTRPHQWCKLSKVEVLHPF